MLIEFGTDWSNIVEGISKGLIFPSLESINRRQRVVKQLSSVELSVELVDLEENFSTAGFM